MPPTHYTLTDEIRFQSIELLNLNLANSIDLYTQLKCAAWNVQIIGITNIKHLFEINSKSVLEFENILADRINALGGNSYCNVQFVSANSVLIPYELGIAPEKEHGFAISSSMAAFSQAISNAISISLKNQDFTTADIFSNILRIIDAAIRRLSMHLEARPFIPKDITNNFEGIL